MPQSSLQSIILKLQEFWAAHGCLISQPYYTQVGAGTMNPSTFLRVLGPEPWNVGYVEPSVRPDDGRYGENPNRFEQHTQFQVILKPDPGNPVELYIQSLEAIGIDPRLHDIRLVEDNWEQPAISAWGLGWEIWLDGQEITQFTYFQQVGGQSLDPVSVEITYGLERILIALNNAAAIWDEPWGAGVTYGEIRRHDEFEQSKYYFETADVTRLRQMYDLYKAEADACLEQGLVVPAHDYVLKCSHTFNILDTRGAIGVTERQAFFGQMRDLARRVAETWLEQRKELEYPLLKESQTSQAKSQAVSSKSPSMLDNNPADFLLEIGVEELPAKDIDTAIWQLKHFFEFNILQTYHLKYTDVIVYGTPRRLVVYVTNLEPIGETTFVEKKGPPESVAFIDGKPTKALFGWIKSQGLGVPDEFLTPEYLVKERDGGRYVFRQKEVPGSTIIELFPQVLPFLIREIKFDRSMRWLPASHLAGNGGVVFSRPIRWLVSLLGETVVPFEYAGLTAGRTTRGLRPYNSPKIEIPSAEKFFEIIKKNGIILDVEKRKELIAKGVKKLAASVNGEAIMPPELLNEVANLVEKPMPFLGSFEQSFLSLPGDVLVSVMKKHQRYFPVERNKSKAAAAGHDPRKSPLLPYFVAVRNGDEQGLDLVRQGNEHVVRARFADANFFVGEDLKHKLEDFRPRLGTLMFQKKLGSMLDKNERIEKLTSALLPMFNLGADEAVFARRAAHLLKADLVSKMVIEMTSLQGIMGAEYARRDGEAPAVAEAIGGQYQPVPPSKPGLVVALADRLDSLAGLFAAGLAPTGTKDPFGLRRAAIGVVQPLIEYDLDFNLGAALKAAAGLQPLPVSGQVQAQVMDFISGRLRVVLLEMGFKHDVVDAVLAAQSQNPAGSARAVRQLSAWVTRPDWSKILPGYARCVRITRDQENKFAVNPQAFIEVAEKNLFAVLLKAEKKAHVGDSVDDFLETFIPLIPAVNEFFDKVLVMTEDKSVQENRLGLLQRISSMADGIADFSKLEGF